MISVAKRLSALRFVRNARRIFTVITVTAAIILLSRVQRVASTDNVSKTTPAIQQPPNISQVYDNTQD